MRKIVLFIAALLFMTVPVMAAVSNVTITCLQGTGADLNSVTVSYQSNLNLIRAFGLDIQITSGGAHITKVVPLNANYRIYPGQITIVDGNVTNYGTCYDPCDMNPPDANVTVEMGSLYTTDSNYGPGGSKEDANAGYDMIPGLGKSTLLKFYVSGNCTYAVTKNVARGGVVMENPAEDPTVATPLCSGSVLITCTVPNVVNKTQAEAIADINAAGLVVGTITPGNGGTVPIGKVYAQNPTGGVVTCGTAVNISVAAYCMNSTSGMNANWVLHGRPKCWCYAKQCRGDINGAISGPFWVALNDRNILVTYLNAFPDPLPDPPIALPAAGACADLDHLKSGLFWVSLTDRNILVQYLNQAVVPDCGAPPDANFNFWCTPGMVSTGCP
jgi:hypothetical protein